MLLITFISFIINFMDSCIFELLIKMLVNFDQYCDCLLLCIAFIDWNKLFSWRWNIYIYIYMRARARACVCVYQKGKIYRFIFDVLFKS